jgi:hypothetical protein
VSWNYRVLMRRYEKRVSYAVHEVYYGSDKMPRGWTESPSYPRGDTEEELRHDMERYAAAFQKPVLIEEDLLQYIRDNPVLAADCPVCCLDCTESNPCNMCQEAERL